MDQIVDKGAFAVTPEVDSWRSLVGLSWQQRHRGPYRFQVIRPFVTKPGFIRGEWLKSPVDAEDAAEEARSLLLDPRDTICTVHLWSEREGQFVMTWRRSDFSGPRPGAKKLRN
jgi:hypothetical protein